MKAQLLVRAMWCYQYGKDPTKDKECSKLYGEYSEEVGKAKADEVIKQAERNHNARQRPRH